MLSPYASVVEKLHRDVNKERVTMLKVERAGDVLVDAVSQINGFSCILSFIYSVFGHTFHVKLDILCESVAVLVALPFLHLNA